MYWPQKKSVIVILKKQKSIIESKMQSLSPGNMFGGHQHKICPAAVYRRNYKIIKEEEEKQKSKTTETIFSSLIKVVQLTKQ